PARQDQPATAPSSDAAPADAPKYPVAYGVPTVPQVTDILQHLRERLEAGTGYRIINSKTRQEITDLSKPDPDATLDSGPQRKFSPYSYPMGVVYSGMLSAADATGDKRFADFVARRFQLFADKLPQLSAWPSDDLRRNPFRNMIKPGNLDACGAMGAAMIKARRAGVGPDLSNITNHFAEYISKQQFRLEDGTLARKNPFPQSLWLDDAYMSVPLLAQQGKLTGETRYFDDAAKQIKQFYAHLFIPSKGLFTHAGNMANADNHPEYCWGRANGWFMVA